MQPSHLSKIHLTKSKTFLADPFGQCLLGIFTAFSACYVESLHHKASALYKYPATRCKNNLERSTGPSKEAPAFTVPVIKKRP
nr:hypothetical protein [Shewanella algidipiscicola]